MGIRLIVRGFVMNLVDYLYGGGEGKVLIGYLGLFILWGKLIFGYKIRKKNKLLDKFIVKRRK